MKNLNWKNLGWAVGAVFGVIGISFTVIVGGGNLLAYLFGVEPVNGSFLILMFVVLVALIGNLYQNLCAADERKKQRGE